MISCIVESRYSDNPRDRPIGDLISKVAFYPIIFCAVTSDRDLQVGSIIFGVALYPSGTITGVTFIYIYFYLNSSILSSGNTNGVDSGKTGSFSCSLDCLLPLLIFLFLLGGHSIKLNDIKIIVNNKTKFVNFIF